MKFQIRNSSHGSRWQSVVLAFAATLLALPVQAALTIPVVPPRSGAGVPPNILFILDDSGSMTWQRMPQGGNGLLNNIESRSYVFNTIYYDPRIDYQSWMTADGVRMTGGASYNAVYPDFSLVGGATIDLSASDSCQPSIQNGSTYNVCGGVQTFYVPRDMGRADPSYLSNVNNYYRFQIRENETVRRCERIGGNWGNCADGTPTGRSQADERRNYAIWFSYHRTRMKVAKAGASEAFNSLDGSKFRIGYNSIWNRNEFDIPVNDGNNGLFEGDSRQTWFSRLFEANAGGTTPLLPALSRAGEYYSQPGNDGPYGGDLNDDGSQFACRQNFSILTTDGFWNNNSGAADVGNADGTDGPTVSGPSDASETYQAEPPYQDNFSGTLADVAMHYWKSDLRDLDNIVPWSSANPAFWQHMVTFGISIGLQGTLNPETDLPRLSSGEISWPNPMDQEDQERIDDLWHAAVNSRGEFVAASDPAAFAKGLQDALSAITGRTSSASNVAANSTSLGTGTKLFQASYVGGQWTGELRAFAVDEDGIAADSPLWEASEQLPAYGSRRVFTRNGLGGTGGGATFPTSTQQTALGTPLGSGAEVANYLKGDSSREKRNTGGVFRDRLHALGDIIHSSPAYVEDSNTVFVGGNDGMLHAFNADTGAERFAYVPASLDMTQLRTLSNPDYAHQYFVDGPLAVSSKQQTPNRNILVGTLGRGGRGVYGLNVTSPDSFGTANVLWDRGSADLPALGNVIGDPIIAKLNDGSTGVIIGNGMNSAGDEAVLLVLDIEDGSVIASISTDGSTANGLSAPRGWDTDADGDVDYVYAGDLQGNVWKFDLSAANSNNWDVAISQGSNARPLFVAKDASGNRQPITGGISIGIDPSTYKQWVFVGTGRFLTADDPEDDSVQSMYGLIDEGAQISGRAQLQERTTVATGSIGGTPVRGFEASDATLDASRKGWYIDFAPPAPGAVAGERMVGKPALISQVLLFSSIIPSSDPCTPGGRGFVNALNAFTGASVGENFFDVDGDGQYEDDTLTGGGETVPVGSVDLGVGMNTDPLLIEKLIGVGGSGGNTGSVGVNNPAASGRVSWRELITD